MMNPLTNSKHCSYFFSLRCLCFGKDLTGFISRDVERWKERREEEAGRG